MFSSWDVIRLFLLSRYTVCVTTHRLEGKGAWFTVKINKQYKILEGELLQDVTVHPLLEQSANPAEPAVWCRWQDSDGHHPVSALVSPAMKLKNVRYECIVIFGPQCYLWSVTKFPVFIAGNWSLWGDQQSKCTYSSCSTECMKSHICHSLVSAVWLQEWVCWWSANF